MKLPNCKLIPKSKQSQLYLIAFKLLGYPLLKRKGKKKKRSHILVEIPN